MTHTRQTHTAELDAAAARLTTRHRAPGRWLGSFSCTAHHRCAPVVYVADDLNSLANHLRMHLLVHLAAAGLEPTAPDTWTTTVDQVAGLVQQVNEHTPDQAEVVVEHTRAIPAHVTTRNVTPLHGDTAHALILNPATIRATSIQEAPWCDPAEYAAMGKVSDSQLGELIADYQDTWEQAIATIRRHVVIQHQPTD